MGSRRHINVRGKSANLPAITDKDWKDIRWGIHEANVDYFALSFVRDADVIHELKEYLIKEEHQTNTATRIGILAKIESADSTKHLEEILDAVDGAMVARGDLGAELPVEEVPFWQDSIVRGCRRRGKPCIVATNMLESMISHPLATRAEVTDISVAVREGTDAVMLSGETAYGGYPLKSVQTMSEVCRQTEEGMLYLDELEDHAPGAPDATSSDPLSDVIAFHAAQMSDTLACPLIVFSRRGNLPKILSRVRPNSSIFCFTDNEIVQRRLALYHGVHAFALTFDGTDSESAFLQASEMLLEKGYVSKGDPVVVVRGGTEPIWKPKSPYACQIRML
jgi:pyruvate kinase